MSERPGKGPVQIRVPGRDHGWHSAGPSRLWVGPDVIGEGVNGVVGDEHTEPGHSVRVKHSQLLLNQLVDNKVRPMYCLMQPIG